MSIELFRKHVEITRDMGWKKEWLINYIRPGACPFMCVRSTTFSDACPMYTNPKDPCMCNYVKCPLGKTIGGKWGEQAEWYRKMLFDGKREQLIAIVMEVYR
jgi:hypothetical protein